MVLLYSFNQFETMSMALVFLEKLPFHPLIISLLLLFIFIIFLHKWLSITQPTDKNSPPSPPKIPIIGNLHQLGRSPHRSLKLLSDRYGKLMLLHVGSKPTLVVSSSDGAREIMMTQEMSFINRPILRFINRIFQDGNDIAFSRYGEYWRCLKSIAVTELLSNKKVQSFQRLREEEVALMVGKIKGSDSPVNLSGILLKLTNDVVSRAAFGRKYGGTHFEELFKRFLEVMGAISVGDFVPWLGWIDRFTGLEGKAEKVRKDFDEFFKKVIQERVDRRNSTRRFDDELDGKQEKVKDLVDILLQIQMENPASLSTDSIHALILDIFVGATESTYIVLEWAMTELLKNPRVMKELQEEVRGAFNGKKRVPEEYDLKNMKYLNAVIKETLRVHPPGPLVVFRECSQDVKINGYDIVSGTQVIINIWAIQHDKNCWEKPEEFYPERFINSSVDFRGQHFQLIPFGGGRRGCPGISYSLATIELVLASLVYEFDWKLPGGVACETLDAVESEGIIVHRRHPLTLIATPYN